MPVYTYRCEACARLVEASHAASEELTPVCRDCGGIMRRVIVTPPAVHDRKQEKKIDHDGDVAEDKQDHHHEHQGSACVLHHLKDPE